MSKSEQQKTLKPVLPPIGVDDGFSCTNIWIPGVKPTALMIPSRARSGVFTTSEIGGTESDLVPVYASEGMRYTVGDASESENADFPDYPFSAMNRAIVHHALRVAGLGGQEVQIATGLPLQMFYNGDKRNDDAIQRKVESLLKDIQTHDGSPTAKVVKHAVYPEGLSAWVDYAVNDSGELTADLDETVGVIDMGGRTLDIAVILPGRRIDHGCVGSEVIGAHNVVELIEIALRKRFGVDISGARCEKAMRSKTIRLWGKVEDISAEVDAALAAVTEQLLRAINRRLGNGNELDRVLIVGGGAHLFSHIAKSFRHAYIPESPEFANARGFAKYMALESV